MTDALVQARSVSLVRAGRCVLEDIDLAIENGEYVAIVGPNGAGKSTLLHVLAGGLKPGTGTVHFGGRDMNAWRPSDLALRRAVLTQSTQLAFSYSVGEVLMLSVPEKADRRALPLLCERALERVGLTGFQNRAVVELSGGEQQRVHLARILVQLWATRSGEPQVLFLDEPVTGLDLRHQVEVMELANALAGPQLSVVAIVHDLNMALRFASRAVCLSGGRIVGDGVPRNVLTIELIQRVFEVQVETFKNDHGQCVLSPSAPWKRL